jgi:hypothetical protein|tara:strand:+ start:54 stop:200 length:147 start_codon:yes stop_codon:yes gene_type:complete
MIKKTKGGYKLYSKKTGKPLSKKPKTHKAAVRQEAAINITKQQAKKEA